jgi:hypothetical protein
VYVFIRAETGADPRNLTGKSFLPSSFPNSSSEEEEDASTNEFAFFEVVGGYPRDVSHVISFLQALHSAPND